jgi:hypothetical protein
MNGGMEGGRGRAGEGREGVMEGEGGQSEQDRESARTCARAWKSVRERGRIDQSLD